MARKSRKTDTQAIKSNTAMYMRTAQYIRLSVEDNGNKGNSIENQSLILDDFIATSTDLQLYDTYIDNGISGTTFNRPEFQRMLGDIEAGKIDCVVVKDLSRLGRSAIDTGFYIEKYFASHKVRFIAVNDNFDTDKPNSNGLIMSLKNIINEAYAIDIGKKIRAQQKQAIADGDYVGARPLYGYLKAPDNCHKLIIDEKTAPIVKQIFEWAYEKVSLNEIVLRLNEAKISPPNVYSQENGITNFRTAKTIGAWNSMTLKHMIVNRIYTGDMVQGKSTSFCRKQKRLSEENWVIVQNTHEPLVSREKFDAIQEHLKNINEKAKQRNIDPYTPNIFLTKVFCGHCGKPLHRQRRKNRHSTVYYFSCPANTRVARGICESPNINESDLTVTVISVLRAEASVVLGERDKLCGMIKDNNGVSVTEQVGSLKQYVFKNKDYLRSLYENLMSNIITADEYHKMKADYEKKISEAITKIHSIEQEQTALKKQYEKFCSFSDAIEDICKNNTLTAELIKLLIDKILVYRDKRIEITFAFDNEIQKESVVSSI